MAIRLHRVVAVSLTLALLAACGGGGGDDDTQSASDSTSSTAIAPGADNGSAEGESGGDDGKGTTPTSGAAKPPSASGSGGSGNTSAGNTPTTGASAPPRTGDERTTAPGTYTYKRTRNGQATDGTLVVHPPAGAEQRSVVTYPGGESSETVTRTRSGGVDLVLLRTTTPLLGTKEFRPSPPVQFAPDPATVGATWSWRITSTDEKRTLDGTFRIARGERIDIGGEQVDALVVESTVQVSGDITGTLHQTMWVSTKYRLAVRIDERLEGAFAYTSSATLASTRPS